MSDDDALPAIVLAGGTAGPELEALTGQSRRALIQIHGRTLLTRVLDALQESGSICRVLVVGDVPEDNRFERVPDQGSFVSNVLAGLSALREARYALITTSDLPFLTGDSVRGFLQPAMNLMKEEGSALVWPVVPIRICYERYPGIRRTALRTKEGYFTGGNLMLVRPEALINVRDLLSETYAARKSILRLAGKLGVETMVRLLLSVLVSPKWLPLSYLEKRVSGLLGVPARALVSTDATLATDLDRVSDFMALGTGLSQEERA
ncbi:MAG: nucleotidyltransferase family protein [Chloroherpetonaceae bacterium]|nr:nucleotidyltransferase family protein [Chthonomonadaceae bacterium]MDW8208256.1 nucleotidyltransferase family protein [Chloroherpetonaceae bacterium]